MTLSWIYPLGSPAVWMTHRRNHTTFFWIIETFFNNCWFWNKPVLCVPFLKSNLYALSVILWKCPCFLSATDCISTLISSNLNFVSKCKVECSKLVQTVLIQSTVCLPWCWAGYRSFIIKFNCPFARHTKLGVRTKENYFKRELVCELCEFIYFLFIVKIVSKVEWP